MNWLCCWLWYLAGTHYKYCVRFTCNCNTSPISISQMALCFGQVSKVWSYWTLFISHVQVRVSVFSCDCQLCCSSTVPVVALLATDPSFVLSLQGSSTGACNACFTWTCLGLPGALSILVLAITATFLMAVSNFFYFFSLYKTMYSSQNKRFMRSV